MNAPDPSAASSELIRPDERARVASGLRVALALMALVLLIVVGLTGLIIVLTTSIFEATVPSTTADLEWKAKHGAIELSKTCEIGLVLQDAAMVQQVAQDYVSSSDVAGVLAVAADGTVVLDYGKTAAATRRVFDLPPHQVHRLDDRYVSWSPAAVDGQVVGRVATAVSRSRLHAGDALKGQIVGAALIGGLVAILLSLAFMALYIVPVLRVTRSAFERLEHTTQLALEAARLKAQFLANMSHEIRTPMNAVVGLSRLMLGMPLMPKVRRYAEMIDASSRALLNIINDILDFSKIEAGKYEILRAPMEPALLVQEVAELLADRAQGKGVDLVYRIAPGAPCIVEADADRVRQVLTNLVGNAVKFTERGEVYVQLLAGPIVDGQTELRFEVHDSGVGVATDLRDHIFEAFSQADGSMVRKHGGTGLGLTISKQLVQLMGGTIGLESELGQGSCFWFSLPVRVVDGSSAVRAQPTSLGKRALLVCDNERATGALHEHLSAWGMTATVAETVQRAEEALRSVDATARGAYDLVLVCETHSGTHAQEVVSALRRSAQEHCPPIVVLTQLLGQASTRSELDREIAAQLAQPVRMSELYECLSRILSPGSVRPAARPIQQTGRNFAGARVLVVDDNEMNQFVAVEQLKRFGCTVDQALDGKEALEKVLAQEYALVLMDCQMPIMDGYTATREIRAKERGRRTAIIALTAHALTGERERVLAAGMDDYLTKPVRPGTLQRTLERWLVSSAAEPAVGELLEPFSDADAHAPANSTEYALEDCATELLELMLDKLPAQLERLDGALALGELAEARAHAHKLKGSLLAVSAVGLAQYAEQLQHLDDSCAPHEAEALCERLLAGYAELERSAKQELSQRARAQRGVASA